MTDTTVPTLYKFLRPDGLTLHDRPGWHLPKDDRPGEWMPPLAGELVLFANAYQVMDVSQLLQWADQDAVLYEIEWRDGHISDKEKHGVRQARLVRRVETWNDRTLRLFAADCAERALPLFEQKYPGDTRPRQAVEVARRYANGQATAAELDAARSAASDVAWAAASDAASDAAWAAWAAAWDAASAAARAAASAAARAASAAERQWQTARLAAYLSGAAEIVKVQP